MYLIGFACIFAIVACSGALVRRGPFDDCKDSVFEAMINAQRGRGMPILRKNKICYDELGCFDRKETLTHISTLPDSPQKLNNSFILYNRLHPQPQLLKYSNEQGLREAVMDTSLPFKFVIHGFGGHYDLDWMQVMKDVFLDKYNVNVVLVDWSIGATEPFYYSAMANAEVVARELVVLFRKLGSLRRAQLGQLHLIGFSMGGQVIGMAGKYMFREFRVKPDRVTGLDPAAPMFEGYGHQNHLYKTDGEFVDVIHTNADGLTAAGVGMKEAVADADFYPNGGERQPGCKSTLVSAISDLFTGDKDRMCNHLRAVHLFIDSLKYSCAFTTYACKDYQAFTEGKCGSGSAKKTGRMGYDVMGSGAHFVQTFKDTPYCASNAFLKVVATSDQKKNYGQVKITIPGNDGQNYTIDLNEENGKIEPGAVLQVMAAIPPHDGLLDHIFIQYNKYKGWFYSGYDTWNIREVTLVSPNMEVIFLHTEDNQVLNTGEVMKLNFKLNKYLYN